jgi:branched-chain amino acid transport system substrate-binding protein
MLRQASLLLLGTLALAGCGGPAMGPPPVLGCGPGGCPGAFGTRQKVAILLPLSGPRADLGQAMLKAAQLALEAPDSPMLDARDTGGSPEGAAAAAREAMAGGDQLILGPLTSPETAAVAPIAQSSNVDVLSFTNDPAQARPGVWTLGITPGQQVRRLVSAAQGAGKSRFAGLLPDDNFGRAMADALSQATASAGLPPPTIRQYAGGMASISTAARDLSDYANRRGPIEEKRREAKAEGTPEGRERAAELSHAPVGPPPFDALLLAGNREALTEIASFLPYYDVNRSEVQFMGPLQWADPASGSGQFPSAWYAAPDPSARQSFEQSYSAKYGAPPPALADLAYDGASIARALKEQGFGPGALTQREGFSGTDGLFGLEPDGHVRRSLAVFQIQPGGPQMMQPAPNSLAAPGV